MISAAYSDNSSIDINSIILKLDGIDVTSSAAVEVGRIFYTPVEPLAEDIHDVYLEVKDNANNTGIAIWSFTVDTTLPFITDFLPFDNSSIRDNIPIIGATYSDNTSIDIDSVVLKIDEIDVTSLAAVTAFNIIYIPTVPLTDGVHNVYLEVKDNATNTGIAIWSFTVDTTSPLLTNLQPSDKLLINYSIPTISAIYTDNFGINISSVSLKFDNVDVTSNAEVKTGHITYTPSTSLSDGLHNVHLEVKDLANNTATAKWSFTIDATIPLISSLQPSDKSTTNNKTLKISAVYTDNSSVDLDSVLLRLDGTDITPYTKVTASNLMYTPKAPFSDGVHNVYLEVKDMANNTATASWSFTVDTTPPITNAGEDKRIKAGNTVKFNGNASTDNIDSLYQLNFTWKITIDGKLIQTLFNVTPSFSFDDAGQYKVELIVRDKTGNNGFATMLVIVSGKSQDSDPESLSLSNFLDEYWFILLIIIFVIALTVVLFLYQSRKKESRSTSDEKIMEEEIEE
jgi:hypothetical protein